MPHGRMPVLEFPDGKKLSQTFAIGRYLGNKYRKKNFRKYMFKKDIIFRFSRFQPLGKNTS